MVKGGHGAMPPLLAQIFETEQNLAKFGHFASLDKISSTPLLLCYFLQPEVLLSISASTGLNACSCHFAVCEVGFIECFTVSSVCFTALQFTAQKWNKILFRMESTTWNLVLIS